MQRKGSPTRATSEERSALSAERYERIWATVCDVPKGAVASYGQIAELAGLPRGARQVGRALKYLPNDRDVPWHRVVTASGRLAFEPGSRAFRRQASRLKEEEVPVLKGKVNMGKYRWRPDLDELLWKPSTLWDGA